MQAMSSTPEVLPDPLAQKRRTGLNRLWHAAGHSVAGLRAVWSERAFRQEASAAIVLVPGSYWVARNWAEAALLAGSVLVVMTVELLNSAIESVVDRVGPEWHPLSKRAKDMGSAAVLLSLVWCAGIWVVALWQRFGP
jgi:diacylglycerol kinase (ATP)